jgi:hypothetical protein
MRDARDDWRRFDVGAIPSKESMPNATPEADESIRASGTCGYDILTFAESRSSSCTHAHPYVRVENDHFVASHSSAATLSLGCSYSTFNPLSEYRLVLSGTSTWFFPSGATIWRRTRRFSAETADGIIPNHIYFNLFAPESCSF